MTLFQINYKKLFTLILMFLSLVYNYALASLSITKDKGSEEVKVTDITLQKIKSKDKDVLIKFFSDDNNKASVENFIEEEVQKASIENIVGALFTENVYSYIIKSKNKNQIIGIVSVEKKLPPELRKDVKARVKEALSLKSNATSVDAKEGIIEETFGDSIEFGNVSMIIGSTYQNQGLGKKACAAILSNIDINKKFHVLVWITKKNNLHSVALARSCFPKGHEIEDIKNDKSHLKIVFYKRTDKQYK